MIQIDFSFKIATNQCEFDDGRVLFQQYANSLSLDLSFQGFSKELEEVDIQYNKPGGSLILAYIDERAVGCAGIRELERGIAELKRMFVQPEYQGYKIGRKLLEISIDITKELNYSKIRLDTLPEMTQALKLYRTFGFYEIPAYRYNPVMGTVYMEKELANPIC